MAKVSILGCGAWGIGIAVLLNNNGHNITMWSAVEKEVEGLKTKRENEVSLKGVILDEKIKITSELKEATLMTLTEVIEQELPDTVVTVLSGPSHAEEVGRGKPTTCVVGAKTKEVAEYIQEVFMSKVFRVYTSPDILGIEIGGSLKNVIALAAGMADGLGYGDNTKAALITRGIAEITRLGMAMGAKAQTFGDLIVTCASMHSRNRRAGILIGQGKTPEEAMKEVNQVVEGVYSAKAGLLLAKKYNVALPIIEQVCSVLFDGKDVNQAVEDLMLRDKTSEISEKYWNN